MEGQQEVIWMHFFSFFDTYVISMAGKAKLRLKETSQEETWRWFSSQPCWEVAWGAVTLGRLVGLKWQVPFDQVPRAVLEASFRQGHCPSLCLCNSTWVLYDLGVSKRYLVDITMETESLTNCFGEHLHTRGSTDGGMLGSWAEICCQLVSQESVHRHGGHAGLGDGEPVSRGKSCDTLFYRSMRGVFEQERGRGKGRPQESRCWLCGLDVCFFSRHLELESQLCDFLIAGQDVPASFACFHKHWQIKKDSRVSSKSQVQFIPW